MTSAFPLVLVILYFCFVIGIAIFVLVLLTRFVGSHERIAAALERIAQNPSRENR